MLLMSIVQALHLTPDMIIDALNAFTRITGLGNDGEIAIDTFLRSHAETIPLYNYLTGA